MSWTLLVLGLGCQVDRASPPVVEPPAPTDPITLADPPPRNPIQKTEPSPEPIERENVRDVQQTVRRYAGQMKYCYERRMKTTPDLAGTVEMGWTITDAGKVTSTHVISNTTGDAELGVCMQSKIKRWRFPESAAAGDVTWPFNFSPKR